MILELTNDGSDVVDRASVFAHEQLEQLLGDTDPSTATADTTLRHLRHTLEEAGLGTPLG